MQIICNNCGSNLEFPNRQVYVTCPQCFTHLQIEELENTISATIVENVDVNNALFASLNQITTVQSFTPLYNLLHLELEYNEEMEENFFHSVLVGKPFFPIMSRGIYRLMTGLLMMFFFIVPNIFNWFLAFFMAYGGFLVYVGIKELIKVWRFRQFEKYYFPEQAILNEAIQNMDLSDKLNRWYFIYSKNMAEHLALRAKYFYINFSDKLKIKIVTPLLSQGLRLLTIIIILVSFMLGFEEAKSLLMIISLSVISLFLVALLFLVINKSDTYVSKYLTLLKRREEIIAELKEMLSK